MTRGRLAAAVALVSLVAPVAAVTGAVPACAAGEVRVSVVVDFGDLPSPPPTTSTCVAASDGDSGAEILAVRARQLGTPQPRFDSSGLLCAIDGLPSAGCGERTQSGYRYWSYWHGSAGGWEYSSVGPTGTRVKAAQSEGWRFTDGTGRPNDPAPRGPADPASVCRPAQSPPASTAPAPTAAAAPSPTASAGGAPRSPTAAGAVASTALDATTSSTTGLAPSETSTTAANPDAAVAASARSRSSEGESGGGRTAGTALGMIAVMALAGGGAFAAHRRKRA